MKLVWIRLTDRQSIAYVQGRIQPSDQAMVRKSDGMKGAYDFRFNGERTMIIRTEHPEWTV